MLKKNSNLLDFCKGSMRKILGKVFKETKKIEVYNMQKKIKRLKFYANT